MKKTKLDVWMEEYKKQIDEVFKPLALLTWNMSPYAENYDLLRKTFKVLLKSETQLYHLHDKEIFRQFVQEMKDDNIPVPRTYQRFIDGEYDDLKFPKRKKHLLRKRK